MCAEPVGSKLALGNEWDTPRLQAIRKTILGLGFSEVGRWDDGLGDFNQVMYRRGSEDLLVEWELYMGISAIGQESALAELRRRLLD